MTKETAPTKNRNRSKQRITPRALLEAKRLSEPKIHPDGRHVVFVVTEADFDESRWVSHLWLTEWPAPEEGMPEGTEASESRMVTDGTEDTDKATPPRDASFVTERQEEGPESVSSVIQTEEKNEHARQLTFSYDGETRPRWSPDGRYLAFLSARPDESEPPEEDEEDEEDEPKQQLWVLPAEAGEARKITSAKEGVLDYAWTPDGSALIYLAPEPRPRPIESVRKEERSRRKLDPVVEQEDRLRRQFWRVDVEERKPKLLYTGDYGIDDFALSPDGERIGFVTNYTGEWNDYHKVDLWILNLADGKAFQLLERRGGKYRLRWSPDGTQIAFLSWLDPQLSYSRESLFVADVPAIGQEAGFPTAGSCRLATPESFDYDIFDYEWSRHDGALYVIAAVRTGSEIYRLRDGEMTRLELGDEAERHALDLDPEGDCLAYVQESATALEEIFLRDEQGEVHQLTRLNAEFGETYRLPGQEVVRWKSPDGLEVEGVLTYPLDHAPGRRAPLVVQIHGGPKGRSTNTIQNYSHPMVWATEGWAVLRPNYRGSEGYGHGFAIANRRDLGGGDFADIMAGVDALIDKGLADPDQLGVMGGSYGGYMTNWVVGHTDRFKAAVSLFGIFHLQTDYSNSDLSSWDNDYLGAYYWEDPEIYRRLSPGSYLENIQTPTLIIHGESDNNTFISNSKEMYQALRHRGVITQFVHYPREGHGLREPNHKLDEIRRCLAWMDRYVRHGGQAQGLYRVGDRVPGADGLLEMRVTRAEIATFLGRPKSEAKEAAALLEVVITLHNVDTRQETAPITLEIADLRLTPREAEAASADPLRPVGVPMDLPGGKVLVEGERLRIVQHPDADTRQLAFACAAVFEVPKAGGDYLLRVADFPPVAVTWSEGEEEESRTTDV
ncbi:MAG TPA: S9 family peptidase [Chthonomonadaceae bacterium]|nr:S9 family peptidase [Chthonomonadaceae bacterium]